MENEDGNRACFPGRLAALLAAVTFLLLMAGCTAPSSPVTIPDWQKAVVQYVQEDANGDAGALRNLTWGQSSHHGFTLLGTANPRQSTDADGLLLAHRNIGGHNWFIYLVGLVEQRTLKDLRLAALNVEGGKFHWLLSPENSAALETYRQYRQSTWKALFPGQEEPPVDYWGFPLPDDSFQVNVSGDRVQVVHPASGAQWMLSVPATVASGF